MRTLAGWIRNLADGLGPPTNSVTAHATYRGDNQDLNLTTHQLGGLTYAHVLGGSGSTILADDGGHFGWTMEQSPGQILQSVTPSDPRVEWHLRYPDESAQVGKAFHSDLERLAWTAGRDGIVWNAISGGNDPASAVGWSHDPTNALAWGVGNGSISSFGPTAGKVTIRPFIAFVGGAVFSVEMGDLEVPPAGGTSLPANGGGGDRWDLLYLKILTNPALQSYGKQTFELLQGTPGAGIPTHPGQTSGQRIMPLYALKKAAGATAYSAAYDLRRWLFHPAWRAITRQYGGQENGQLTAIGVETDSTLNTAAAAAPLILPPGVAWQGYATLNVSWSPTPDVFGVGTLSRLSAAITTEALDVAGVVVPGSGALLSGVVNPALAADASASDSFALTLPLSTIPSYHTDSGAISDSRAWHTLRLKVTYFASVQNATIYAQQLRVHVWPDR